MADHAVGGAGASNGSPGVSRIRRASNPYFGRNTDKALQQIDSKVLTNTMMRPSQVSQMSHAHRISDRSSAVTPLPPVSHENIASWNFQFSEKALADELQSLLSSLKRCLELRTDYMAWSLQRIGDNPKDSDSWDVFPPVPKPSYQRNDLGEFVKMDSVPQPVAPADFDMAKVQIPVIDNVSSHGALAASSPANLLCS
jgi:hypothetical protein